MKKNHLLKIASLTLSLFMFASTPAFSEHHEGHKNKDEQSNKKKPKKHQIKTEVITYKDGNTVLEGYLAYPEKLKTKRPGILVVHDWIGVSESVKERAEMLANMGYVAFAADIYGKGVNPKAPKEAGEMAGKYKADRNLMRSRVKAGLDILTKHDLVDKKKVAAIGYCFGGTVALELGRSGADIDGIVSFHGGLDSPNPADGKNIKAKVLVLHGADDPYVPESDIKAFVSEMNSAKVDWQMISYSDSVHAFTIKGAGNDKSTGAAYNKLADKRSWEHMKVFFHELFK